MELTLKERFEIKSDFIDYDEVLEETLSDITRNYLTVGCLLYKIKADEMYRDFIKLISKSSGTFYTIDFYNYCINNLSPTSD